MADFKMLWLNRFKATDSKVNSKGKGVFMMTFGEKLEKIVLSLIYPVFKWDEKLP